MGGASYSSSSDDSDTSSILASSEAESPAAPTSTIPPPVAAAAAVPSTSQPAPQQQPTATAATTPSNTPRIRHTIPTVISDNGLRLVPRAFQHCEMADIIALTAHMLDRIIAHNDALPSDRPLTRFHSRAAPAISPHAYLTRITTFTNVDPCIIVILLYYIDKLSDYLTISSLTIHRFLISAICCGSKALSDSFATNSRYARVGGVELIEMNALEREFLLAINWRLATSGAMLEQYWITAVEAHPGYQIFIPPVFQAIPSLPPASLPPPLPPPASTPPPQRQQQQVLIQQGPEMPATSPTSTDQNHSNHSQQQPINGDIVDSDNSRPSKRSKGDDS
ncbi:cyclin-domain-containing protein [Cystobasidium minutum MCA 4210]|uniref:cyclin-domain-containing protein n=1 Tax=Cystobasidium minutum MCA 4210 TaxID=1397322 RepID=UPI0034CD8773|eukprot:jgi/Rhomi1/208051/estExt_Genemark1.C_1_t30053